MHLKGKIYNFMWTSYLSCFFVPLVLNSFLYFSTPLFLLFFLFQGHRFWAIDVFISFVFPAKCLPVGRKNTVF